MFSRAIRKASGFTRPLLTIRRYFDKTTDCGCGAFIVLNEDGWIVTAAHMWRSHDDSRQHARELSYYDGTVGQAMRDRSADRRTRRERVFGIKANPRWITSHAFWWGRDDVAIEDVAFLPEADLAVGRLVPFEPEPGTAYPVLKVPSGADVGTSLCKLGYPFNRIDASFDETDGSVALAPGILPLTLFPIEGICTRILPAGRSRDGRYEIAFLETSSPGLIGQSGGPIFDTEGKVWAIQSRTDIHPMCASVLEGKTGRKLRERHFLEVGVGIHAGVIASFLSDRRVSFSVSDN